MPPVGDTVDVENASWSNTIGDPELITVWTDPEFDAKQRVFYYARVLEIPTPRWTAYDAKRFGIKALAGTSMKLQERAYIPLAHLVYTVKAIHRRGWSLVAPPVSNVAMDRWTHETNSQGTVAAFRPAGDGVVPGVRFDPQRGRPR